MLLVDLVAALQGQNGLVLDNIDVGVVDDGDEEVKIEDNEEHELNSEKHPDDGNAPVGVHVALVVWVVARHPVVVSRRHEIADGRPHG